MRSIIVIFLFLVNVAVAQQEPLTLDFCQKEARNNFPLIKGKALLGASLDMQLKNLRTAWLPSLWANGKATYQSDVPGVSIPGMNAPSAPKDQYAVSVDVEQLLYDGGRNQQRLKLEKSNNDMERQSLEVQLYQLNTRVNSAFFTVLMMRKNMEVLQNKKSTINQRLKEVSSAVSSGALLPANQKLLMAELLMIDQQSQELEALQQSALDILSVLMNRELDDDTQFKMSSIELMPDSISERPEYQWYQSQREVVNQQQKLVRKDRLPVLSGFGQLGYGNPGMKFLADEFSSYYMVGVRLRWNLFDWKKNKKDIEILDFRKQLINTKEESFTTNLTAEVKAQMRKISSFKILLVKDDAIIPLREEVAKSAASQLKSGVSNTSDYLEQLDREVQARLNKQYHTILLQQAKAEYNRIVGRSVKE